MYAADGTNTRTYNDLGQLTGITQTGTNVLTIGYSYPSTGNNGRISGMVIGGESITYAYDVLNQLMTDGSSTRGTTPFDYDQYGNLTRNGGQTIPVNPANNRLLSSAYDANGNYSPSGYAYDIENRLTAAGGADNYGYDTGNKRVWKKAGSVEQISFYGREGRLGIYTLQWSGTTLSFGRAEQNYYFAGRLLRSRTDWSSDGGWVLVDRLGSVVKKDGADRRYAPYGQEYTSSPNNEQKFGTYYRDDQTGLDYADQRYYQFTMGRFSSPDNGPMLMESPASFNRYSYSWNDPVNYRDSNGMLPANVSHDSGFGCVASGFSPRDGAIDASVGCPPGMRVVYPSGIGIQTRTQRVHDLFDGTGEFVRDWEYANAAGTSFNITMDVEDFMAIFSPSIHGDAFAAAGVLVIGASTVGWEVAAGGAIVLTGVTIGIADLLNSIIRRVTAKDYAPVKYGPDARPPR